MIITFELQGITRVITYDGSNYIPRDPETLGGLGYFSSIGGAVAKHIKVANRFESKDTEEIIDLKQYISRFHKLYEEICGKKTEDLTGMGTLVVIAKNELENNSDLLKRYLSKNINKGIDFSKKNEEEESSELDEF